MRVNRFVGLIAAVAGFSLVMLVQSCMDKGTEPPPNPLSQSPASINIVPNTSRTITIMGGTPPYRITRYPKPQVGTASFDDSTKSPAKVTINVISSASVGDHDTISVADAGSQNVSVYIGIVEVGDISYSDDIQPIFDGNCQNRGCHPGGGAPFSLNRFVSYNNLFYFPATNMSCGVVFRVVPFQPDSSLLYLMVSGRTACPRMPYNPFDPADTLLFDDQVKIHDWIEQGAQNN